MSRLYQLPEVSGIHFAIGSLAIRQADKQGSNALQWPMLKKMISLGLIGLTLAAASFGQTANDLAKIRDELGPLLKARNHWSQEAGATFTLGLREAFKAIGSPGPDGSTLGNATVTLQFGRLPDGVIISEIWALQLQKDAKARFSLVPDSLKQQGGWDLRGLRLPSKNETLLLVFKTLRSSDLSKQALPYADRIVQAWFVDAFKDPANPALEQRMEIRRDAQGNKAIWYGSTIAVLLDHEYFQDAGDQRGGLLHLRGATWFQVRLEKPAGGEWRLTTDPWQVLSDATKISPVGQANARYRPEFVGLFRNLARDGIDLIFGEQTTYLSALAKATDYRLP